MPQRVQIRKGVATGLHVVPGTVYEWSLQAWTWSILNPSPPGHRVRNFCRKSQSIKCDASWQLPRCSMTAWWNGESWENRPLAKAPKPPENGRDSSLWFSWCMNGQGWGCSWTTWGWGGDSAWIESVWAPGKGWQLPTSYPPHALVSHSAPILEGKPRSGCTPSYFPYSCCRHD